MTLLGIVIGLVLIGFFLYGVYYSVKTTRKDQEMDEALDTQSSIAQAEERDPNKRTPEQKREDQRKEPGRRRERDRSL